MRKNIVSRIAYKGRKFADGNGTLHQKVECRDGGIESTESVGVGIQAVGSARLEGIRQVSGIETCKSRVDECSRYGIPS